MIYAFYYSALIHGKWKPGKSDNIKLRFNGYNKGNFKFSPSFLYVVDEGYEEQSGMIEKKVLTILYDYLENPEFYNTPTEYVNPDYVTIDAKFIKEIVEKYILDNHLSVTRIKQEFVEESVRDVDFLTKIRMFPNKYTEKI